MLKISWTDRVRNEESLQRRKGVKCMLRKIKHEKANWTVHTMARNCLLKHLIEGTERKIEGKGRQNEDEDERIWVTLRCKKNIRN